MLTTNHAEILPQKRKLFHEPPFRLSRRSLVGRAVPCAPLPVT